MLRIEPAYWIHTSRTGAWRFSASFGECCPHPHGGLASEIGGFMSLFERAQSTLECHTRSADWLILHMKILPYSPSSLPSV
jgi:hypothetical protein